MNYPGQKQQNPRSRGADETAAAPRGLRFIAFYKLFKGLVLLGLGFGAVKVLHWNTAIDIDRWTDIFRADRGNHYIHLLIEKLSSIDNRKLREFSVGTFIYSALQLTEGTGLVLGKSWAKYFTIISTSGFLPLEMYEIARRASPEKIAVLLVNVAVVAYLANQLWRAAPERDKKTDGSSLIPPAP